MSSYLQKFITYFIYKSLLICIFQVILKNFSPFYQKTDETHYLLDNKGLNKQQLLNLGVLEENIQVSSYCTNENNDLFFSHRVNHDGQRNVTIIKRK